MFPQSQQARDAVALVAPDAMSMSQIRSYVRTYIEVDDQLRKLRVVVRERVAAKNAASEEIVKLMKRFNIEDLNTKDGSTLRLKESRVKEPLKRTDLKERVRDKLNEPHDGEYNIEDAIEEIFENRPTITKEALQRIMPK